MKSVNMSRNLWNTGSVSTENLPKREVNTNPNENTDSGQRYPYISMFIVCSSCPSVYFFTLCIMIEKLAWCWEMWHMLVIWCRSVRLQSCPVLLGLIRRALY